MLIKTIRNQEWCYESDHHAMKAKTNIYLKTGTLIILILLMMIPVAKVQELIYEREQTQREAIIEVSSKWAGMQTISGPVLSIPYIKYIKQKDEKDRTEKLVAVKDFLHILPETLEIDGQLMPEKRNRGIFEIVVYKSSVKVKGRFNPKNIASAGIALKDINYQEASLDLGLNDLRGIEKEVTLHWGNSQMNFMPGLSNRDIKTSGISAKVDVSANDSSDISFSLQLQLKGSEKLYFTPCGKENKVQLSSSWPDPGFNGAFLPESRVVNEEGFKAEWNILHLNRNYPQVFAGERSIDDSEFGVDLIVPVDQYQKSTRAIKYAILFIVFTFIALFFMEVFNKAFIHPVQYLLVTIALVIFYTLLVSISEHLPFNSAFIISASATLMLIGLYIKAILKSNFMAMILSGILFLLYSFVFVMLQIQDYALLIGSIGIFSILALIMYLSRKINWYQIRIEKPENSPNN